MNKTLTNGNSQLVDPACYAAATAAIRSEAVRLLEAGEVAAVIGYRAGRRVGSALPEVAVTPEAAAQLLFSAGCQNNLALFLSKAKRDVLPKGKVAVVVKGCDLRALAGLIGEAQLKRDEVHVIGVACPGVYGAAADLSRPLTAEALARKCRACKVHLPEGVDLVAGTLPPLPELPDLEAEEIARLEAMTPQERWSDEGVAAAYAEVKRELSLWEQLIVGDHLAGPLSAADYTLFPEIALARRIAQRKPGLATPDLFGARMTAWIQRMEALPVVQRTWPPHWRT